METTIDYDTVKTLIANPPSMGNHPIFQSLRPLQSFCLRTQKDHIPLIQRQQMAGFVLSRQQWLRCPLHVQENAAYHGSVPMPEELL